MLAQVIASYVSALGTLAAVVAASFAARAAIRSGLYQQEQLRILGAEAEARFREGFQRQADQIACWATLEYSTQEPIVSWINLSGLPVYNLTFWVTAPPLPVTEIDYSIGPPRIEPKELNRVNAKIRELGSQSNLGWTTLLDLGKFRSAVAFRDINGNWWLRDFLGKLESCESREDAHGRAQFYAAKAYER